MTVVQPPAAPAPPEARRAIRLLQLTAVVSTLDRFVMAPMLLAIAVDLGVPLGDVLRAAGLYFLAYGLSQPVWGLASDHLGRVRTMRLTLALAGVCSIGSAFVAGPLALGVVRGLAGGFYGAAYPSCLVYIADTVPMVRRQRDVTALMVGVAVGTSVGVAGGGLVADVASWRLAFVVTGGLTVSLAWFLRSLPEPPRGRPAPGFWAPVRLALRSPWAYVVFTLAFLEGVVLVGGLTVLPAAIEATGVSASMAGFSASTYGIAVFFFAWLVGSLSRTWSPASLICLGVGATLVACLVVATSQIPVAGLAGAAVFGLGWAAMHSTLQTWATEVVPDARAFVVSLFAGSLFIGSSVSAVLVAAPAEHGDYSAIFLVGAALTVPLGAVAVLGRRRWGREQS
jgi:predicted MFS family arabinose efflux permease